MNLKDIFRQEVLDLSAYHLEAREGIKLNQNESPWDLPVELKTTVVEDLLKIDWNRYPLEDPVTLKKKMAKHLNVWPDNLVFANGSNVLIQALTFATSINRGIMIVDPTFGVYEIEGKLFGNKVTRVPLNDDFSLPVDKFIKTMKRVRPGIIFIPNPNAPTGNLFPSEDLIKIIISAECLVVIDEAYFPFSGVTLIDQIKEHDNLVILRTFSKAFALGGLRLGWMIADTEVCQQIQKCLLPFCLSRFTYTTAMVALDAPEYINHYVKILCSERDRVFRAMSQIPSIKVYPTQANFILFETSEAEKLFNQLLDQGVIVRQVSDGRRLSHALRVTIGSPEENDAFLAALGELFSQT